MFHDFSRMAAAERRAGLLREAEREHLARTIRTAAQRARAGEARVSLRLDRVWDSTRLHELADASGRRLPHGPLVVAEVGGRIVAAFPVSGGAPVVDPAASTTHVLPLLELRAQQIRSVTIRPTRRFRLLPRRA